METVLTLLINDLIGRAPAQEHAVLVLDNFQVVTLESIHDALSFLLEHLPPQVHLVLATREDPPLPLAQLRGRDDLLEIRASDLRFTQEEAATFLVEMMGLPLSTQESALLHAGPGPAPARQPLVRAAGTVRRGSLPCAGGFCSPALSACGAAHGA